MLKPIKLFQICNYSLLILDNKAKSEYKPKKEICKKS